jgi:hypothetical protein
MYLLALKALAHVSLGQRPRLPQPKCASAESAIQLVEIGSRFHRLIFVVLLHPGALPQAGD